MESCRASSATMAIRYLTGRAHLAPISKILRIVKPTETCTTGRCGTHSLRLKSIRTNFHASCPSTDSSLFQRCERFGLLLNPRIWISVPQPCRTTRKNHGGNERILTYMLRWYPEPKDFASFVYLSQVLQAEAIKVGAEHLRRQRPNTMGSLYWQLNDCWPVASWASIDYFGRWKALQYYARRFYDDCDCVALRA